MANIVTVLCIRVLQKNVIIEYSDKGLKLFVLMLPIQTALKYKLPDPVEWIIGIVESLTSLRWDSQVFLHMIEA